MNEPFRIGLCMAGAISAGAYTAGVVDFLNEALAEWEHRKRIDPGSTPSHAVEIPLIGGASAGGMTGIILAAALYGDLKPIHYTDTPQEIKAKKNRLYNSWVGLVVDDMLPVLLHPKDVLRPEGTLSLLNSDFIDHIAAECVKVDADWTERSWFPRDMKVFTTLTNLEGFGFAINFNSDDQANGLYHVRVHNDYACFILNKTEGEYAGDGWIPLDFRGKVNTDIAKDAAMGTGAFPIGLRSRELKRPARYINDNDWFKVILKDNPVTVDPYVSYNVDGGVINNEPFDRVRELLLGEDVMCNEELLALQNSYDTFTSTVLMVDPFPSSLEEFDFSPQLLPAAGSTLSAMMSQLRTKPTALADAMHSNKAGQFLIAPSRRLPAAVAPDPDDPGKGIHVTGASAIACGTLAGFGGFLHKEFRVHDYFLGRANCERFLRDRFTVPYTTTNPIFTKGYHAGVDKEKFRSGIASDRGLQIIPLFSERPPQEGPLPLPVFQSGHNWPVRKEQDITRFRGMVKDRASAIIKEQMSSSRFKEWLVTVFAKGTVADTVIDAIIESLRQSYLLPGEPKKPRRKIVPSQKKKGDDLA